MHWYLEKTCQYDILAVDMAMSTHPRIDHIDRIVRIEHITLRVHRIEQPHASPGHVEACIAHPRRMPHGFLAFLAFLALLAPWSGGLGHAIWDIGEAGTRPTTKFPTHFPPLFVLLISLFISLGLLVHLISRQAGPFAPFLQTHGALWPSRTERRPAGWETTEKRSASREKEARLAPSLDHTCPF